MNTVYTFSFIVFCIFLNGCVGQDSVKERERQNLEEYFQFVNQAENLIICKKFSEAESKYSSAWDYIEYPFPTDIYNRMVCNHQLGNVKILFNNAQTLVLSTGISLEQLKEKYRFLLLYSDEWEAFNDWYDQGFQSFAKNKSDKLSTRALEIQLLDQKFRNSEDRYTTYKSQNDSVDSLLIRELIDLIDVHGYPTSREIGVLEVSDSKLGFQGVLDIAILHAYQNTNRPWIFEGEDNLLDTLDGLLQIAIQKGRLHPEQYNLFIYGREVHTRGFGSRNILEPPITIIEGNFYMKPLEYEKLDSINLIRNRFHLDTQEEFYSKALFLAKNPNYGFNLLQQSCCVKYHLKNPKDEIFTAQRFGVVPINFDDLYVFDSICNN